MKISDLILVQKGKSSQLGILLALKQNQLESISASGHLMIHSKRDVTFASPEWGKSLSPSPIHSLPQILPTNQKKIINAGMEVSVLLHLQRFHRAAVMMQQKISPLISDFHSTLDPSIYLDLDTITTSLFKTSPPTPAQKYAVTRALEDTLYFIKNLDPYNPVFRPRPEEEIKEIKQLLNLRIDLPLEIQDFIKKSQSLIKSFRSGHKPRIEFNQSDIRLITKLEHVISLFPDPINLEIRAYQHLIQQIYQTDKSYLSDFVNFLKAIGVFRGNEDLTVFKKSDGKRMRNLESHSLVGKKAVEEIEGWCSRLVSQGPFVYGKDGDGKAFGGGHDNQGISESSGLKEYKSHIIHATTPPTTTFPQKDEMENQRLEINQTVFVIDDVNAHELDDGVSLEKSPEGDWIHVHIANPTAYIPPSHPLSYHAQLRGSSIYLPQTHYPMMNDSLAKNLLDLGGSRCALTFSARLDGDGEICDYKVTPTLINRALKVSYNDIDTVLNWDSIVGYKDMNNNPKWINDHFKHSLSYKSDFKFEKGDKDDLLVLQKLAVSHSRRRFQNGGFHPDMLAYNLKTTQPQTDFLPLTLKHSFQGIAFTKPNPTLRLDPFEAPQRSPAKLFVQEFMIIAGRVASKFAQEHKLPVGYRTQKTMVDYHNERFSSDLEHKNEVEEMTRLLNMSIDPDTGAVPDQIYRKLMAYTSPASISSVPGKHANMGIKAGGNGFGGYLKVTSPLRRYLDMHSHYQIQSALLDKSPPFDEDATLKISERMIKLQSRIANFQKQSSRYWMLEYMRRKAYQNDGGYTALPLNHLAPFERNLVKTEKSEIGVVLGGGGAGVHSYYISLPYYGGFLAKMKPRRSLIDQGSLVNVIFDKIDPDQGIILATEV